jgi:hypothetical protein
VSNANGIITKLVKAGAQIAYHARRWCVYLVSAFH